MNDDGTMPGEGVPSNKGTAEMAIRNDACRVLAACNLRNVLELKMKPVQARSVDGVAAALRTTMPSADVITVSPVGDHTCI